MLQCIVTLRHCAACVRYTTEITQLIYERVTEVFPGVRARE